MVRSSFLAVFIPTLPSRALYGAQAGQQLCASPYAALISPASSNASYALALWPARTACSGKCFQTCEGERAGCAHFVS